MLKGRRTSLLSALALSAAICLMPQEEAFAADSKVPKKRWEKLRDSPIDYAPFQRRRAENLKAGTSPLTGALARGFASPSDIGTMPVITDPTLTKAISLYAQKLMPETLGLKPPEIEIVVVDDLGLYAEVQAAGQNDAAIQAILAKEAANFTAVATGGGAIVLGISVLKTVKNFDELDFLVAHEASHILYDHFTEDEERKKLEKAIGIGILIAALVTRRADPDTRNAVAWTSLGLLVANSLLGPAWTRGQEEESDELGLELMMEAGKSADGVNNVMERFQKRDDARKAYLDVMCGPDSAGENFLKGLIGSFFGIKIPDKGYDPTNPVCAERRNLLASLFRDHPETKERRKNLDEYQKKFYADRKQVALTPIGTGQVTLIEFLSPDGESSRLVKAYSGLEAFRRGDIATARSIEKSLPSKGQDELQLAVLELRYLVANADGKRKLALGYLEDATKVPEPNLRLSLLAESEYVRDGSWSDAARIVRRRLQRNLVSPIQALPLVIRYLKLAGKSADMEKALGECRALGAQQPALLLACEAEATRTDIPAAPSPAAGPPATPAKPGETP